MVCDHSELRLKKAESLGMKTCNNCRDDLKKKAISCFWEDFAITGPTVNVDIYIDAAGAERILDLYQDIGKVESRMVVLAALAGKRPVNIQQMTFAQHALIGSGGYMEEDVLDVMEIMKGHRWDIECIITHIYPWEQLPNAIKMVGNVEQALNVVIRY